MTRALVPVHGGVLSALGMIVAQHRDAGILPREHGGQHFGPRCGIAFRIDLQSLRRAIPFGQQRGLALIDRHIVRREGPRREAMQCG